MRGAIWRLLRRERLQRPRAEAPSLESTCHLRHPAPMSLRALHRHVSLWIQRPVGQLAGLLLLVAMISAGMPTGKVHAHVDGDHSHDHAAQLADGLSDHNDVPASNPIDTTVLHAHDVGTTASTLPTPLMLMLSAQVPMAPIARLTNSPPPSSARIPPHRPPIA